jgi:hypothetical protein
MWYSLLLLGYKPVRHVTVLNTVGNCNTVVSIIILWDHRRECGTLLTETSLRDAYLYIYIYTYMRRLTTGIRSEKCVVRRFRRRANVIECTYTNLDSIVYPTAQLGYMV